MRNRVIVAVMLILTAAQPLGAEQLQQRKFISETTVKLASAMAYANLLEQARQKGWQFSESDIESGSRHHYDELRLRLVNDGYTVLPADAGPTQ